MKRKDHHLPYSASERTTRKKTIEIIENVTDIETMPLLSCFSSHITWNGIYVIFKNGEHLNKVCLMNNWCREYITDTLDDLRIKFVKKNSAARMFFGLGRYTMVCLKEMSNSQ